MNRRVFNLGSLATILGLPASYALADTFDYPWNLGIITDQVDLNLGRVLKTFYPKYQLRWAEIRYVELGGKQQYVYNTTTPDQLKEIKRQLDDAGVRLSVLDTAVFKIALPGTTPVGEHPAYLGPQQSRFDRQIEDLSGPPMPPIRSVQTEFASSLSSVWPTPRQSSSALSNNSTQRSLSRNGTTSSF